MANLASLVCCSQQKLSGLLMQGDPELMEYAIARARGEKVLDDPKLLRRYA